MAAYEKRCAVCGGLFAATRSDARTCSRQACKKALYRRERAQQEHLQRRADAARKLIAADPTVDRFLILSYVVAPSERIRELDARVAA